MGFLKGGQLAECVPVVSTFLRFCSISTAFNSALAVSAFFLASFFLLLASPNMSPPEMRTPKTKPIMTPEEVTVVVR